MDKNKLKIIITAGLLLAAFAFLTGKNLEAFNRLDHILLSAAVASLAVSVILRYSMLRWLSGSDKITAASLNFLWKLLIFLPVIPLLWNAFELYRAYFMFKAVTFFFSGLLLAAVYFSLADDTGAQVVIAETEYKNETLKAGLGKIAISAALSGLGIYFIFRSFTLLSVTAFAGALVQLVLAFRSKNAVIEVPVISKKQKPAVIAGGKDEIDEPIAFKILSVVLIAASFFAYYLSFIMLQNYDIKFSLICFMAGSLLFGWGQAGQAPGKKSSFKKEGYFDAFFCIFLFITGCVLFSHQLLQTPPGIYGDELLTLRGAQQIGSGQKLPVYFESGVGYASALHPWLTAAAGKIFGINIVTARWISVIFSCILLVFTYLLVKELFNRRAAILASVLSACFFMVLLYSRIAISWIFVPALAACSFYFFFLGLKRGNTVYYVLAGIAIGFNLYFYPSAKAAPLIYAAYVPFLLLAKDTGGKTAKNLKGILALVIAAAIVYSPVIMFLAKNPSALLGKTGSDMVVGHFPLNALDYVNLCKNIIMKIQMFFTLSADGYGHNLPQKPFFDSLFSVILIAGMGFLAFTWKRKASFFILLWVIAGMLPSFLSYHGSEEPFPSRAILAIPAILIAISIGIDRTLAKLESLWPVILKPVSALVCLYFIAWFSFCNLHDFFVVFRNDPHTQVFYKMAEGMAADHVIGNKNEFFHITTRMSDNYHIGIRAGFDSNRMVNEDISVFNLSRLYNDRKMDEGIIGEGIYYKTLPIYREYFPGAKINVIWDRNFWMMDTDSSLKYCYGWKFPDKTIAMNRAMTWWYFYDTKVKFVSLAMVDIPWADINKTFSLHAKLLKAGKVIGQEDLESAYVPAGTEYDGVEMAGLINVPAYGRYEFKTVGSTAGVFINDRQITGPVELWQGLNRIKVKTGRLNEKGAELVWKQMNAASFEKINRSSIINSDKLFGLTATYSRDGKVIYMMNEPAIDYRLYYSAPRPPAYVGNIPHYDISWDGYINITEPGAYRFILDTIYNASITVDGRTVFNKKAGQDGNIQPVQLSKGKKRIKVSGYYQYISTLWGEGSTLRLLYKKDSQREFRPVTYDMLSPY